MPSSDFSFQAFGFAVSIAGGVILGACYDILRIWRILFHTQKRAVFFQDFFYMAFAALFTFLMALSLSGKVRLYILLGEFLGFFSYYYTVGQITAWLFKKISHFLYKYLFYPLGNAASRFFSIVARSLCKFARLINRKIFIKSKKCLKNGAIVVYNYIYRCRKKKRKDAVLYARNKKAKG